MDTLIEELPQLIISIVLIIGTIVLLVLRTVTVLEGMPLLVVVATYWIGNGAARFTANKLASQTPPTPTLAPRTLRATAASWAPMTDTPPTTDNNTK